MPEEKERVKDKHADHKHIVDQLSPNMQAFDAELSAKFPDIRYTSGRRKASQGVGKNSKVSHHNTGDAGDIDEKHTEVFDYLMNTQEGLQLLNKYNLGIIDETDPETLKKTGGTAPHFHIGKDSYYAQIARERLKNFDKITPIYSYGSGPSKENKTIVTNSGEIDLSPSIPFKLDDGKIVNLPIDVGLFEREIEKEDIKNDLVEKSPYRQKIEEEQQKRRSFLQEFSNASKLVSESPAPTNYQSSPELPDFPEIDVQNSLPELPNIFNIE